MENGYKNKVVCVLGMHRSGTSMVTRILNICGVYIGEKEDLIDSLIANEKGHWESSEVLSINDEILRMFGSFRYKPPKFYEKWENDPRLEHLYKRGKFFAEKMNAKSQIWGFKDPRTCLTLPFWKKIIPDMLYVIPVRDAFEVAASLKKRDGSSEVRGLYFWAYYWENILENTENEKNIAVSHKVFS
jgi:hypothetical protein